MKPTITIITPWLNHPELIEGYEAAVQGVDELIIVDNGSTAETQSALRAMHARIGDTGAYIRNDENRYFSAANNQGLAHAPGDIVVFLNNDISGDPGWLEQVRVDVEDGYLCGPAADMRVVAGQPLLYIEGWCIAARREVWEALGGWDEELFRLPYWDDVDLCWRARRAGYKLRKTSWSLTHLSNTTSRTTPGAYDGSEVNRQAFELRVREAMYAR